MDEYGGKLENWRRLIRELIEETKEEVGDQCAVAFRFAVDEVRVLMECKLEKKVELSLRCWQSFQTYGTSMFLTVKRLRYI